MWGSRSWKCSIRKCCCKHRAAPRLAHWDLQWCVFCAECTSSTDLPTSASHVKQNRNTHILSHTIKINLALHGSHETRWRYQAISRLCSTFYLRLAHSRHLLATHVQHIHIQRTRRGRTAHSCSTEAAVVRAAAALPPRHACQGWPHACRPRHCVQARDHLWYGREDHDRHTAATRCANPTRDHPRLCARHDRCRQPSATIPISQDTRLR